MSSSFPDFSEPDRIVDFDGETKERRTWGLVVVEARKALPNTNSLMSKNMTQNRLPIETFNVCIGTMVITIGCIDDSKRLMNKMDGGKSIIHPDTKVLIRVRLKGWAHLDLFRVQCVDRVHFVGWLCDRPTE
jgi:hypothetical protein